MDKLRLSFQQIPTVNSSGKGNTPQKKQVRSKSIRHKSKNILFSNMSDSNNTYDSEDLLLLEIKLLKRENAFLKKKIDDLNKQKRQLLLQGFNIPQSKKQPYPKKGRTKDNRDEVQISIEFFFKEINNLINSVADVFQLQLNQKDQQQYHNISRQIKSHKQLKSPVLKKQTINQRLERIILQTQQRRYPLLLSLFTDYYKVKTTADKDNAKYIDSLTDKTIQLNYWMLQKIRQQKTQKKLKSDLCQTQQQHHEEVQMPQDQLSLKKSMNPQTKQRNPTFKTLRSKY